jgi:DUF1680 family protein
MEREIRKKSNQNKKNHMKKLLLLACCFLAATGMQAQKKSAGGYPFTPVSFTAVKVAPNTFWGQRLQASRKVTIPLAFSKCEETGRYENFIKAAHPSDNNKVTGYSFDDTDPYKTIEGASYQLQSYPDKRLEHYIDSVVAIMAKAQEPDGYLYTARTMNPKHPHEWAGDKRWSKEEDLSHELYDLGHMVEGAVAYYQATGKRNFLDLATKYADCVCREVGPNPGQACVVPGHQIAEMALCRLYLATGQKKYLDEAKFFLDYRGKTETRTEYNQSHKPILEQDEAVGHAVRAGYMYSGIADVAALTGDTAYIHAIDRIWDNIVGKKFYITGGVGATASGEAFGANYELPNMSAYCETCAAIAQVYLNYRLFLLHGESKYYDALERTLYNGLISGVSLDGGGFFYPNPLQSMGQHQRQPWFGCACCPSNIARFIPSLPGYVYATKNKDLYVNLYMSNSSTIKVEGKNVALTQSTNYPWDGDIKVTVGTSGKFRLMLRIPGWVRGQVVPSDLYNYSDGKHLSYTVKVNGKSETADLSNGYFPVSRNWKKGDVISLHFDMEARTVRANGLVAADKGRVAVERGPLVYCAEWPDNKCDVLKVLLNQNPNFDVQSDKLTIQASKDPTARRSPKVEQTYPIVSLTTDAQTLSFDASGKLTAQETRLKLIPYYAWCHRGSGNMAVWMAQDLSATSPALPPSIASQSKVSASLPTPALGAVNDRLVPADATDRSIPYYHTWPKTNSTEWLQYTFSASAQISCATVYWFDDGPWGGCRVPDKWSIEYQDAQGKWQPVAHPSAYTTNKGVANTVTFDPVNTSALRLNFVQPEQYSTGVFEWIVK